MAFTSQDFEEASALLLPQGRVWEQFREQVHVLLRAMAQEPARLAADAEAALEAAIPDNALTDLDAFERIVGAPDTDLTDAERLARIQALMFGRRHVNLAYLQDVVRAMSDHTTDATLANRAYPPAAVGELNVGDSLAAGEWDSTWLCELMQNVLTVSQDHFSSGWTGLTSVSSNAARSPVTLAQTAAAVTVPSASWASTPMVGPSDDISTFAPEAVVYASIWIFAVGAAATIDIGFLQQDGASAVYATYALERDRWFKISFEGSTGTGSNAPLFRLRASAPAPVYLSWQLAGVRDLALQARVSALFPIHTHGHFAVESEFTTSLAHSPQYEVIL